MKIYDIVSLEKNSLSESPTDVANNIQVVFDKQVLPDGRIRVMIPAGPSWGDAQLLDFRNEDALNRRLAQSRRIMAQRLTRFSSLRRLAFGNFTWWPAAALQIFEAVETAMYEFNSDSPDYQAVLNEAVEAATIVIVTGVTGTARRIASGARGLSWIRQLTTARRSAQMATAALGAAGFATGGTSWIGALITGAGWIATEIALYFATEYFVGELVDEFFSEEELSQEVATELADELAIMLGLTRDARHVDNDGDGEPDNVNPETGRTQDPETGQDYKYSLGDLTQADIDRLLNADPETIDRLASNPEYADFFRRYRSIRDLDAASEPQESIQENTEGKVPDENDLRGFINYLDEKGYDEGLKRQVMRVAQRKLNQR